MSSHEAKHLVLLHFHIGQRPSYAPCGVIVKAVMHGHTLVTWLRMAPRKAGAVNAIAQGHSNLCHSIPGQGTLNPVSNYLQQGVCIVIALNQVKQVQKV